MPPGEARLFVGQLNFDATEEDVRQIFDFYGHVIHVNILRDKATGRSTGSAFVTYGSTEEADASILALHDVYNMERDKPLQVSYCQRTQNISDFGRQHAIQVNSENKSNPLPIDDEIAHLVKYYQTVQLSGEQKDRLIQRYWEATPEERRIIATVYASLFARDGAFVQRLVYYHDTKLHHAAAATSTPTVAGSSRCGRRDDGDRGISTNGDPPDSSGLKKGPPLGQTPTLQFTHAQLLLRTAIQDKFPKFVGNGPFPIEFGVVRNEEERREVIAMYSTQFQYPDPPELHRLVTLPQSLSTRTRRRANGSYTFYIRSLSSTPYAESRDGGGGDAIGAGSGMTGEDSHCRGEIACAVTLIVHNYETRQFAEMPLFATGVGYKKNGLGRLLNACVLEWCRDQKCEFIMISADVQAVPFWQHCGYAPMSRNEKNRIAFYYDNYCFKFHGAEAMIGYLHQRVERRRGLPTPTAYTALKGGGEPATEPSAESDSSRKRPRPAGGAFPFEAEQFQLYDGADIESGDSEVAAALRLMPRFVVQGPIRLPDP